jgi:hypothetical protein
MHAGVGASGPVQLEITHASRFAHGPIDLAGHGAGILLNLPPAVARAGVLESQLEAGHRWRIGPIRA